MKQIKNAMGTIMGVTLGGVALKAVEGSGMSTGFKDTTSAVISVGIVGSAMKGVKFKGGKNSMF